MLIDFHTHAFPDALAPRTIPSLAARINQSPCTNGTISDLISKMSDWNVERAVVCNIATNPKQTTNVNNFAISTRLNHSDHITSLGSVHPAFHDPAAEIHRLHDAGIVGIKIHPDYMSVEIDDPAFDVIFSTATECGMFLVTHAGFDVYSHNKIWAPPDRIVNRLRRSPNATLICAHFGGAMMWTEVEENLLGRNVYIDTSLGPITSLSKEQAARMLLKHDPDKILFGSDCPWCSPKETFDYIDALAISSDRKEKIYAKNARALLN